MPEKFGAWATIYRRMRRWADNGVWPRVLESLQSKLNISLDVTELSLASLHADRFSPCSRKGYIVKRIAIFTYHSKQRSPGDVYCAANKNGTCPMNRLPRRFSKSRSTRIRTRVRAAAPLFLEVSQLGLPSWNARREERDDNRHIQHCLQAISGFQRRTGRGSKNSE